MMDPVKIGLFTIGQSPREDVVPEMRPYLLPQIVIDEKGLLDGMPAEEIELFKPEFGEVPLVTRTKDGRQIQLSEKKIGTFFHEAVDRMRTKRDVRAVGILCTHDFHETQFSFPVIFPHIYLNFLVSQALQIHNLGVVVPLEAQMKISEKKWDVEKVTTEAKSPYSEGKSWEEIAQNLTQNKVEAVILDCIGYTEQDKWQLQTVLACPVLLPRITLAHAINLIV